MIRTEFPDLANLKKKAEKAFSESLPGFAPAQAAPTNGMINQWPLVVLNTRTQFCHRPEIKGPFSIFSNISGNSMVSAGNRKVVVSEDSFFITNRAQHYTLDIDNPTGTEIFNLHLGKNIWEDFIYSQTAPSTTLLDEPFGCQPATGLTEFPNMLQLKSEAVKNSLEKLQLLARSGPVTDLQVQENLAPLLAALAFRKDEIIRQIHKLPLEKSSHKAEIFKRISLATDFILSDPGAKLSLDELARTACMSKFHFLRAFSQIHQATPHQFLLQYRFRKSCRLLRQTRLPVAEIGLLCGYPDQAVFSRMFRKVTGFSPQHFRSLT